MNCGATKPLMLGARARQILGLLAGIALAGCGGTGAERLVVNGVERTYDLHWPQGHVSLAPVPLVVALHPFTGSGPSMRRMTGLDSIADAEGFAVAYPDGLKRRWNALPGAQVPDDVAFLRKLVDELVATRSVDASRVYLVGASSGAMMTYRLLCETQGVFAAGAVVMGGPMPVEIANACNAPGAVPLLVIHGTSDSIVPWEGGVVNAGPGRTLNLLSVDDAVAFWRERNGCDGEAASETLQDVDPTDQTVTTVTRNDACQSGAPVVLYRVEGGGHTWPGSPDAYPTFLVGPTARDFSASQAVWDFFELRH